jgi:hypothetical protein
MRHTSPSTGAPVQAILLYFVDLCLLRRGPQDLPASQVLLALTLVADLLVGVILAQVGGLSLGEGLLHGLLDVALVLLLLRVALGLTGRVARFTQSATALLGSAALIGVAALLPMALLPAAEGADPPALAVLLMLALIVWNILVAGHILRHTFGLTLGLGAAIALFYDLTVYSLMGALFSAPA